MNINKSPYTQKIFEQYKISITDSGFANVGSEWNNPRVCSPFSRLYYVTRGCAVIKLKNTEIKFTPGNLYLIPLGTRYSCQCVNEFEHLYFHINIDSPNGYDLLRGTVCTGGEISVSKIRHMTELYFSKNLIEQMELRYEICRSIKKLLALQPKFPEFETSLSPNIIRSIEYIRNNLSIQLKTEDIAKNLYLSKNTLAKQFKAEVGISIGKYIDKLVFFEAEKLLTKSSMSLKEISQSLGFCDQFYFSRRFRQLFEETPLQYKKRVKTLLT